MYHDFGHNFIVKEKENMLFHSMAKGTLQIIKKSYNDSQRIFMVENQWIY